MGENALVSVCAERVCCVPPPGKGSASSFYWLKEGRITCMGCLWLRHHFPESGRGEQLAVAVVEHCEAWPQAWLSSLEAFSHAWNVSWSCGIRGRHGDSCRTCRPLRLTGRSVEGVSDGGLVLISSRTLFEGRCPCSPRVLQRRKYRGLAAQW